MLSALEPYVIARESNIVRVDFTREPDPSSPCFPAAIGLRLDHTASESAVARNAGSFRSMALGKLKLRLNGALERAAMTPDF